MNKFAPQQESMAKISACEAESAQLQAKSRNEEIQRK